MHVLVQNARISSLPVPFMWDYFIPLRKNLVSSEEISGIWAGALLISQHQLSTPEILEFYTPSLYQK